MKLDNLIPQIPNTIPILRGGGVILKFAEIYFTAAAKRIFNVSIEGTPVISNFDIFVEAGGAFKAIDKTFQTTVADRILNIGFSSVVNNAKISAIKITNNQETSVNETSVNNTISVYPNPASDKLFYNSSGKQVNIIQLVDLTGKVVYSANVQQQNGSIDLSGFNSGLYILQIHTSDYIFTTKVIIKFHYL